MKNIIFTIFILLAGLPAYANNIIALYPLMERERGVDEMARIFSDELEAALSEIPPGSYVPYQIHPENRWFQNNPLGGSPAYICPPQGITGIASYVITGEVFPDAVYSGVYRLRLYLWETNSRRLLITDEMVASDKDSCAEQMPRFLVWLMSQIGKEEIAVAEPPPQPQVIVPAPVSVEPLEPSYTPPFKRLYFGLRGGAGSSVWYYNPYMEEGRLNNSNILLFYNINAAFQGTLQLASWLAFQTEANLNVDFNSLEDAAPGITDENGSFTSWSLTVPFILKINLQSGKIKAGIFAGVYLYLPLQQEGSDQLSYSPDFPGFVFGGSIGWKAGSGYFFIDGRFDYDGYWRNSEQALIHYRNLVKVTAGYEWGFLEKK